VELVRGGLLLQVFPDDWASILTPDVPVVELFVRITIVYLALYFLLRFVLKREAGALGLTDLLVIVLLADSVQNGMAGKYNAVGSALVLGATLIFWDYALTWLAFHSRYFRSIVEPSPILLIRNGKIIEHNLQKELITHEELIGELRLYGIQRFEDVREARMEQDGAISVILKRPTGQTGHPKTRQRRKIGS
jgi:uncharacterized membrane protein YcaP (DUF421 family)